MYIYETLHNSPFKQNSLFWKILFNEHVRNARMETFKKTEKGINMSSKPDKVPILDQARTFKRKTSRSLVVNIDGNSTTLE